MLHRVMIKTTPLHDVAGRVDYISNPDRQEQLVYADEACADLGFGRIFQRTVRSLHRGRGRVKGVS